MAKLLQIVPAGFSFEKIDGYNKVLPQTIGKYFEHIRGSGTDLYVVKHYYFNGGSTLLAKGYIPAEEKIDVDSLSHKQDRLITLLDSEKRPAAAFITTPKKIYKKRDGEYSVVFTPCQDGLIGCGWYDNADTPRKGPMMASYLLYAYGLLNAEVDKIFWEAAHNYLPYATELGQNEQVEDIDKMIFDSMKETIIKQNNRKTKIVAIDGNNQ